jgi:hypothetical protein
LWRYVADFMDRKFSNFLKISVCLVGLCTLANAQLATSISVNKREFIAGEAVIAEVIITNHTGKELTLAGSRQQPWLTFVVTNAQGNPVTILKANTFGAMKIKAGESLAKQVNLAEYFLLNSQGNFAVSAVIRDAQKRFSGASTNRVLFNLNPGRLYWTQKVGVSSDGKGAKTREMRLLTFSNGENNQIYAQIADGTSGVPLRTFLLGDALMLRKPMVTLDGERRMHVMFLGTPSMWVHCQVNADGQLVKRDLHKSPAQGDPIMMAYGDGSVRVANSIPYDAVAAAKARDLIHKISDRP